MEGGGPPWVEETRSRSYSAEASQDKGVEESDGHGRMERQSERENGMIVHRLKDWVRYEGLSELRMAYDFLEKHQAAAGLADGRHDIDGERVYALMITHQPKPADECRFETHQHYADVVYIAAGEEMIGYEPVEALEGSEAYDEGKDLQFHATPEFYTPVLLRAGDVAVFFPEDGHMPGVRLSAESEVKKIVVKARVVPLNLPRGG
jgi:biofilm protein TabA